MRRRTFLTLGVAGAGYSFAGCVHRLREKSDSDWSPAIRATEPTLSFAERATLEITATGVGGVTIHHPGPQFIAFRYRNANWSPEPADRTDGYPPQWQWESRRSITGTLPIQVGDHAESGAYDYQVEVFRTPGPGGESKSESFSVQITD